MDRRSFIRSIGMGALITSMTMLMPYIPEERHEVWCYDMRSETWTQSYLPYKPENLSVVSGDKLFIFGGYNPNNI